jgi:hypothetical protein
VEVITVAAVFQARARRFLINRQSFQKRQKGVRTREKAARRWSENLPTKLDLSTIAFAASQAMHRSSKLDQSDGGGNVAQPRAADDFEVIRARMEELRRERDAAEKNLRSEAPMRRGRSDPIIISLRQLRNPVVQPH